jgi:tRNA (guanine-N7-)-methyltransferase
MVKLNSLPLLEDSPNLYDTSAPHAAKLNSALRDIQTYYERQWISRGLDIKYLAFTLPAEGELQEPQDEIPLDTYRSFSRGFLEMNPTD